MFFKNKIMLLVILGQVIFVPSVVVEAVSDTEGPLQLPLITMKGQGEPLREVITSIAKQVNYDIAIDEELGNYLVKGNYTQVTVDSFFKRVLHDMNVSVIYNDADKKLFVKLFGKKNSVKYISTVLSGDSKLDNKILLQDEEYQRSKEDPEYSDMSGMTNAEKWEKHKTQDEEYQRSKEDPEYSDMSGMANAEKWEKHKTQDEEYQRSKEDPEYSDMSGMTNAEKWEKHKKQD